MKLKWSNYNIIYECEDEQYTILTNSLNRCVYKLQNEFIKKINAFINGESLDVNLRKFVLELYVDHLLVDENLNEVELFCLTQETEKRGSEFGNIYFIPSFDCDFRCTYCILGKNVDSMCLPRMTDNDVEQAAKWLCETAQSLNIKSLQILLFGGEPLLSQKENLLLMNEINNAKKSFSVSYSLITNGYALTPDLLEELMDCKLSTVQITLDGTEEMHNKRRRYVDGTGTFKKIIDNVLNIVKYNIKIIVRVNVDEENCTNVIELLEYMHSLGLNKRILLHIVPVDPSPYSSISGYSMSALKMYHDIYKFAFEHGFNVQKWQRYCSISSKMNFTIDSYGDVYPCPNFVGDKDYKIADIYNGINKTYEKILNMRLDDSCLRCNLVGFCNGGCLSMKHLDESSKCIFYQANYMIDKEYTLAKYESSNLNTLRLGKMVTNNSNTHNTEGLLH